MGVVAVACFTPAPCRHVHLGNQEQSTLYISRLQDNPVIRATRHRLIAAGSPVAESHSESRPSPERPRSGALALSAALTQRHGAVQTSKNSFKSFSIAATNPVRSASRAEPVAAGCGMQSLTPAQCVSGSGGGSGVSNEDSITGEFIGKCAFCAAGVALCAAQTAIVGLTCCSPLPCFLHRSLARPEPQRPVSRAWQHLP